MGGGGCGIASITIGDWQTVQRDLYERQRRQHPNDWFILADHDELALWPGGLAETIEDCDRRGYDHIRGCLIDRIARDGTFPPLREAEPLAAQLPLGAFFSNPVLGADPRKVVAVKGALSIEKASTTRSEGAPVPPGNIIWRSTISSGTRELRGAWRIAPYNSASRGTGTGSRVRDSPSTIPSPRDASPWNIRIY